MGSMMYMPGGPMPIPGMPDFGGNFIGGSNNGLGLSGAWASGGFNTQGAAPSTGFQQFSGTGSAIPGNNFPAFQAPTLPGVGSANTNTPFGFPGGGTTFNTTNMPGLPQVTGHDLSKIYGKGVGNALSQFLNSGAGFNPAVEQAQLNEALPLAARSESKMMDIFGNTGNAYSSTAALGIGDFESQFNAALQGQFAQDYQQSVQNYLNVLLGVAPSAQQYQAEKPNWMSIAGNIFNAVMPFFG